MFSRGLVIFKITLIMRKSIAGNYGAYDPDQYDLTLVNPAHATLIEPSIMFSNYTINCNSISWNLNSASSNFLFVDILSFSLPRGIASGTLDECQISNSSTDNC